MLAPASGTRDFVAHATGDDVVIVSIAPAIKAFGLETFW